MMNFIKTIGAFSLTFILSVALVGVPKSISDFLAQDVSNGYERDVDVRSLFREGISTKDVYTSSAYKQIINEYTEKSKDLDDSGLPSDFQAAWRDHVAAWSDHANFLNQSRTHCKMKKIMRDDGEFVRTFEEQDTEITRTWFKVLSVARQHGVFIPRNYY
ncbi:hypothetical protein BH20ACI1_BH20ACI1_09000 [soil metagenome]